MKQCEKLIRETYPKVQLMCFHDERGKDGYQWIAILEPEDMGSAVLRTLKGERAMWKKLKNKVDRIMLKKLGHRE
jgi:hypothetical protein